MGAVGTATRSSERVMGTGGKPDGGGLGGAKKEGISTSMKPSPEYVSKVIRQWER